MEQVGVISSDEGEDWGHETIATRPRKYWLGRLILSGMSVIHERLPTFPTSLGGLGWKFSSNPTLVTIQQKHKLSAGARQ